VVDYGLDPWSGQLNCKDYKIDTDDDMLRFRKAHNIKEVGSLRVSMFPSDTICLSVDCCISGLALWKFSSVCRSWIKQISSWSHQPKYLVLAMMLLKNGSLKRKLLTHSLLKFYWLMLFWQTSSEQYSSSFHYDTNITLRR
jgi:hypothetical protein